MTRKTATKTTQKALTPTNNDKETTESDYKIIASGKAKKLSPKSDGHISYELIENTKKERFIRLTGNSSAGIFCKNPVSIKSILAVLEQQSADKPFKSSIMKDVFTGKGSKSANNTSFLIAVLRSPDIALLVSTENSRFLSKVSPEVKGQAKQLLTQ